MSHAVHLPSPRLFVVANDTPQSCDDVWWSAMTITYVELDGKL